MPKGITPVTAMILLILIVVAIGGAFAAWSMTQGQETMKTTEESVESRTEQMSKPATIDGINSNGQEIYLRNLGSSNITPDEVVVYVDDELWAIDQSASDTIQPGKLGTIVFQTRIPAGEHKIRLGTGNFADVIKKKIKSPPVTTTSTSSTSTTTTQYTCSQECDNRGYTGGTCRPMSCDAGEQDIGEDGCLPGSICCCSLNLPPPPI